MHALAEKNAIGESVAVPVDVSFDITNEELISMRALASLVGRSPRTVKRFINTYRLFKAMKIPPDTFGWTDDGAEEIDIKEQHVPIMVLLSVQVGYPDIAVRFFERMDKALNEDQNPDLGKLLEAWKREVPENGIERKKWLRAMDALASVHDLYGDRPALRDLTVDAFSPWLRAVSRFGFQEWMPSTEVNR
jgi:hypothetical protein